MRLVAMTAAACSLFACVALAQEVPAQAPAPAAAESNLPGTTVFSEAQARTHVESRGYTRLRKMEKSAKGCGAAPPTRAARWEPSASRKWAR